MYNSCNSEKKLKRMRCVKEPQYMQAPRTRGLSSVLSMTAKRTVHVKGSVAMS